MNINMLERTRCFVPGTEIRMSNNTLKPIETISIGEEVYSYDKTKDAFVRTKVTQAVKQVVKQMVRVSFENGAVVTCTPNQQFYCKCGTWVRADELEWRKVKLMGDPGSSMAVEVKWLPDFTQYVYDLVIKDYSSYLVTDQNVVVHDFTI